MSTNFSKGILLLFIIFFWTIEIYAQTENDYEQPIQEVFQTELVYPQAKGEIQLTLIPSFNDSDSEQITTVKAAIEYGITNNFQIGLAFDVFTNLNPMPGLSQQGIGALELSTKVAFMNIKKKQLHMATSFEISFPTADINKGLTDGFVEYKPSFLIAKDFSKANNLQLFSQIGVNFKQQVKHSASINIETSSIIAKPIQKLNIKHYFDSLIKDTLKGQDNSSKEINTDFILNLGAFLPTRFGTLVSEFNFTDGETREAYFTPGIVWSLPKNFEIGVGLPIGLNKNSDNFRVIFNFIYEFSLLKK